MRNKYKNYRLNKNGFSLIEILVAMSIFSLIVGGVVLFSVRTIQAHTKAQAMQNAIDNARFATEAINKKIRTSHQITDGGANTFHGTGEIFIVDNVDATKYCYQFIVANETLEVAKLASTDAGYAAATDCSGFAVASFSDIVGGGKIKVDGDFYVKQTDEPNDERGFVQTWIAIEYNDLTVPPAERDSITIQSSVSIRDY